jgi:oligopeptidase A
MDGENPLLQTDAFPIPFDRVHDEHVGPAVDELLRVSGENLRAIADDATPRTFEQTMEAFDRATERLDHAMGIVGHLESVATTPGLRAAYSEAQPRVSEFASKIALDEPLYRALKVYAEGPEAARLEGARKRYVDKTLADFRRAGAELDPVGKERLAALDVELSKLTLKFSQNVLDSTNAFELVVDDEARLSGLPESAIEAARESAAAKGKKGYRFTLQAPSYTPVLTYLDDEGIREALYRAYNTRATRAELDNRGLIAKILELRRAKAELLGFRHFADLVLDDRMAKTGDTARAFITTLTDRTRPFFVRENEALAAFREQALGASAKAMAPWDVGYWAEKQRRALYDFDEEALRPYFALDRVLEGMFAIAERLYGIAIKPAPEATVWHETVRPFAVFDERGTRIGLFYVDVFPRETKRDGAWMQGLVAAVTSPRGPHVHAAVLAANVTPPVGDKPALLHHREVETLFHEFGHLLHHLLSNVEVRALACTNVAWDFVELPSMIMENWCWERPSLDLFARHFQTGEPLPEELLTRMRGARTYRAANAMMRQLGFAELDLALHIDYAPARDGDVMEVARQIMSRYAAVPLPADYAMVASFSHLFAHPVGYAAAYYSYKWAEVLDADAFSKFLAAGVFDRRTGEAFRASILSRGDSDDPMRLYVDFMGREPDMAALFERSGLVDRAAAE